MATQRQIEANRLNSQKSTGPRTPEGKAAVRFNAFKHGLDAHVLVTPGEDQDELDALALDYYGQFRPETPVARYLVDTLVHCDWNRRRLLRLQANVICSLSGEESAGPFAQVDRTALGPAPLDRIFRQLNALERHYSRALAELRRLPEQAPAEEIGFVPAELVGQAVSTASGNLAPVCASAGETACPPSSMSQPSALPAFGFVPKAVHAAVSR
jgi:hypothetical protein